MLIGSFNVPGFGSRIKKNKMRDLIGSKSLEFLASMRLSYLRSQLFWSIPFGGILFVSGGFPRLLVIVVALFLFCVIRKGYVRSPLWVPVTLGFVWSREFLRLYVW